MIAHPFEVKASVSDAQPDVLMITWRGAPAQSVAEIYLPAVASADVIALADTLYGRHRLTATDPNTVQFPASDLTLIPIPAGVGAYAGLLSVDARPSVPVGHDFSVSVRQLNPVTAPIRQQPEVRDVAVDVDPADEDRDREATASASWRRVKGAFQFTFSGKSEQVLAAEQVRLLAWLKWRVSVTPAAHRWSLVLQRYLKQTESLVWDLGTDPNSVGPSEIGTIGGHGGGEHPPFPILREHEQTGKVSAIHYDRFGDFRGFTILTERGDEQDYVSTEHFVEELVRTAWVERSLLRVVSDEHDPERPDRLTLLRLQ
jgi:hypothetical protein